jgi:hypothetical protein
VYSFFILSHLFFNWVFVSFFPVLASNFSTRFFQPIGLRKPRGLLGEANQGGWNGGDWGGWTRFSRRRAGRGAAQGRCNPSLLGCGLFFWREKGGGCLGFALFQKRIERNGTTYLMAVGNFSQSSEATAMEAGVGSLRLAAGITRTRIWHVCRIWYVKIPFGSDSAVLTEKLALKAQPNTP